MLGSTRSTAGLTAVGHGCVGFTVQATYNLPVKRAPPDRRER